MHVYYYLRNDVDDLVFITNKYYYVRDFVVHVDMTYNGPFLHEEARTPINGTYIRKKYNFQLSYASDYAPLETFQVLGNKTFTIKEHISVEY